MDGLVYTLNATTVNTTTPNSRFQSRFTSVLNTWIGLGYCPECIGIVNLTGLLDGTDNEHSPYEYSSCTGTECPEGVLNPAPLDPAARRMIWNTTANHYVTLDLIFNVDKTWAGVTLASSICLLIIGALSVILESRLIAPDTLGYVSSVARNSRYLHLPAQKVGGAMSGAERARALRDVEVMMQDVKSDAQVGKIALGMKTAKAVKLRSDRVYR
jgi:hypothetical protein